jgi:hypothetical protein
MTGPEVRPALRWKDFEDGERWKVALGVWWRIFVLSIGVWWRIFVLSIGVWIALTILLVILALLFSTTTT